MKTLQYAFSLKEKILLLLLVLIMMGLGYYYFVYIPTGSEIVKAGYEIEDLDVELSSLMMEAARLQGMQDELDSIDMDTVSYIESYNASKQEMAMLNEILRKADKYTVSFSDVTVEGKLVRRPFAIQFECSGYGVARTIIDELSTSHYRCLISDIRMSGGENILDGDVSVSINASFYETMTGGVIDAGLPTEIIENYLDTGSEDMVN